MILGVSTLGKLIRNTDYRPQKYLGRFGRVCNLCMLWEYGGLMGSVHKQIKSCFSLSATLVKKDDNEI